MTTVFADTAYWLALFNPRDTLHSRASTLAATLRGVRIVTSEWVLIEVLNGCSGGGPSLRSVAANAVADLRTALGGVVEPQTSRSFSEALKLYAERADKDWSLTDCSSFLIMKRLGIGSALTPDHHFEQAGFEALLK